MYYGVDRCALAVVGKYDNILGLWTKKEFHENNSRMVMNDQYWNIDGKDFEESLEVDKSVN